MFDISFLMDSVHKLAAHYAPSGEEANFMAKLSRIGVKAPLGTPPAFEQLGLAIAKAQIANGGSGNFMGEPLDDHGVNAQMLKAKMVVSKNIPYSVADRVITEHYK